MTIKLDIRSDATIAELESGLGAINAADPAGEDAVIRLASNTGSDLLVDIWASILTGTACRQCKTQIVAWGLSGELPLTGDFAESLPCLAAAPIADTIAATDKVIVDTAALVKHAATRYRGLVRPQSGLAQTLVEFDPDYSVALGFKTNLRGSAASLARRKLFENLILYFRQRLEIGALRRGASVVALGKAGDVGRFLAELHENGAEHGGRDAEGRKLAGTRFMRVRKHIANNREQLLQRCDAFPALHDYVANTFSGPGSVALIEASISDFGPGIVDGFLQSPAGRDFNMPRRDLLSALIYQRLTSKSSDPGAGLGIQNALQGAQGMQAFVSLRTAEFWLVASFHKDATNLQLVDVAGTSHPHVAGTHWQILWPQP